MFLIRDAFLPYISYLGRNSKRGMLLLTAHSLAYVSAAFAPPLTIVEGTKGRFRVISELTFEKGPDGS